MGTLGKPRAQSQPHASSHICAHTLSPTYTLPTPHTQAIANVVCPKVLEIIGGMGMVDSYQRQYMWQ